MKTKLFSALVSVIALRRIDRKNKNLAKYAGRMLYLFI